MIIKCLSLNFRLKETWFEHLRVFVDLGYQGICKDYKGENILIPRKNPENPKRIQILV